MTFKEVESIIPVPGDAVGFVFNGSLFRAAERKFSESSANAQTGFACAMLNKNVYIVGQPGKNGSKGGVIFRF